MTFLLVQLYGIEPCADTPRRDADITTARESCEAATDDAGRRLDR
jgi:hypothetical protein